MHGSVLILTLLMIPGATAGAQDASPATLATADSPEVILREIALVGATRPPLDVQEMIRKNLLAKVYTGAKWREEIADRIRDAWQQKGYFKAEVNVDHEILRSDERRLEVVVLAQVEEGPLYRFGEISFKNLSAFSAAELSPLFPLIEGDVFDTSKIRQALEALRKAYAVRGYINFTCVPETEIDDSQHVISLSIDIDEGSQFLVGSVEFHAKDPSLLARLKSSWKLRVGDVFDGRLAEAFFLENQQALYGLSAEEGCRIIQDVKAKTVAISIFLDLPPLRETRVAEIETEEAPSPPSPPPMLRRRE